MKRRAVLLGCAITTMIAACSIDPDVDEALLEDAVETEPDITATDIAVSLDSSPEDAADATEPDSAVDVLEPDSAVDVIAPDGVEDVLPGVPEGDADVVDSEDADPSDAADSASDGGRDVPIGFARVTGTDLDLHEVATLGLALNDFAYGYGLSPLDADGDGDLALFVGTLPESEVRACVYENTSTRGDLSIRRRDDWCAPASEPQPTGGSGAQLDDDDAHELVVTSEAGVMVVDFSEGWTAVPVANAAEHCAVGSVPGAAALWDVDLNGVSEILVTCAPDVRNGRGRPSNGWVYGQTAAGVWAAEQVLPAALGQGALGIAVLDFDEDGLLDAMGITDSFATPVGYDPANEPGGIVFGCETVDGCVRRRTYDPDEALQRGSFMGFEFASFGDRPVAFMSDVGLPATFSYDSGASSAEASRFDESFFEFGTRTYRYSWGLVADDWNDDGRTDLVVAMGHLAVQQGDPPTPHRDTLFLGSDSGALAPASDLLFEAHEEHPDGATGEPRVSRAALRVDLDHDGRQELIITAANGPPFVYHHQGADPRCTIRPHATVVDTWGSGYSWSQPDLTWRPAQAHGEVLSSDGPWVIASATEGTLRFPSGAVVPFDCADEFVVDVAEPEWIQLASNALTFDARYWPEPITLVEVRFDNEETIHTLETTTNTYTLAPPEGASEVLLRINGRWVGRWLPLEP